MIKRIPAMLSIACLAAVMATGSAFAQKTKVTAYTALENDQLKIYKDTIEAAVPDVDVEWVRDSTGVITARFLAEKAAPKADIVLGLSASSVLLFKSEGLIEAYAPKGVDALKPQFRDAANPPSWVGMDAY